MSEANTPDPTPAAAPALATDAPPASTPAPAAAPAELPGAGSPLSAPTEASAADASPEGETPPASAEGEDTSTSPSPIDTFEFKLPEDVTVDPETMGAFKEFAKTNGLSGEAAQAALDMHIAQLNKSAEAFVASQQAAWTSTIDEWKATIDADPELGGDKKAAVTASIGRALDEFGSPEARQAFELTGAGWNPAIIKFVHKMAAALDEGSLHSANGPSANRSKNPADVLYPDNP